MLARHILWQISNKIPKFYYSKYSITKLVRSFYGSQIYQTINKNSIRVSVLHILAANYFYGAMRLKCEISKIQKIAISLVKSGESQI